MDLLERAGKVVGFLITHFVGHFLDQILKQSRG